MRAGGCHYPLSRYCDLICCAIIQLPQLIKLIAVVQAPTDQELGTIKADESAVFAKRTVQ